MKRREIIARQLSLALFTDAKLDLGPKGLKQISGLLAHIASPGAGLVIPGQTFVRRSSLCGMAASYLRLQGKRHNMAG